jgi:zinc protease
VNRAATLLAAVALLAPPASRASPKPEGRPVEYEGHFSEFPSGMRLVVYQRPQVDRFVFAASYRAGGVDDPGGREGLAHLVEHLSFRSTPGAGAPRIWDSLVGSGRLFNALTAADHTDFWQVGKPGELEAALALEAARMRDPLAGVTEDDFAIERDVVLSEHRERLDADLGGAQLQWLLEVAFPGHPYARPVGGTPESLRRITLGEARAWARERYRPAAAVLVLVSPLPPREAAARVVEAFGPLVGDDAKPWVEPVAHRPPPGPPRSSSRQPLVRREAPVERPVLWIAWRVPGSYAGRVPQSHAAAAAVQAVVWNELGMLNYNFRGGLLDGAEVAYVPFDGAGLIVARISLREERHAQYVLDTVRTRVAYVKMGGWTRLIERVRDSLLMSAYLRLEDLPAVAVAQHLRASGRPDYLGDWQGQVVGQARHDLDAYGRDYLGKDDAFALLVAPDQGPRARAVTLGEPAARPAYLDPLEWDAPAVPAPTPARVRAALRPPGLDRAERRRLPNGLEVVFARRGALPIAEVRLVVRTDPEGSRAVPAGLPALAQGAAYTFGGPSGSAIAASEVDRLEPGLFVQRKVGSSANLDVLIDRAAAHAKTLGVGDFRIFDHEKRWQRRLAELAGDSPGPALQRILLARLFPGHGHGASPTPEGIEALEIEDAKRWVASQLRPERATLLVLSDAGPTPDLWKRIEKGFGRWRAAVPADEARPEPPPLPAPGGRVVLLDRPGTPLALVSVAFRAPARPQRDLAAHRALEWLVESRLVQRLRVEEGATYGVDVVTWEWPDAAAVVAATAVDVEAAGDATSTIVGAVRALAEAPAPETSVAWGRWRAAREFEFRFDRLRGAASALEEIAAWSLPPDHFETFPSSIAALDASRIQAAARALALDRAIVAVSGDAASLLPRLRAEGFEVEVEPPPAGAGK